MNWQTFDFPLLNASLNSLAAVLLCVGFVLIKNRNVTAHKWTMLCAFVVSCCFLTSYLAYHVWPIGHADTKFPGQGFIRGTYFVVLISHIALAMVVPFLAIATIILGLRDRRGAHRKLARWTLPIWLYVSVTGVVIYIMLLTQGAYS